MPNQYAILGALLGFIVWSGAMVLAGTRYESAKCTVADKAHDLAQQSVTVTAQEHVITVVKKQEAVTNGVENAYHTNIAAIDNLYNSATGGVFVKTTTTGNGLRSVPIATIGTNPSYSKKYHLTFKQCDSEEAKFNALWNWANQQANVK